MALVVVGKTSGYYNPKKQYYNTSPDQRGGFLYTIDVAGEIQKYGQINTNRSVPDMRTGGYDQ
jgi:hypothetical protein